MTKQEIFDKVYKHFIIDDNPKGIELSTNNCKYKTTEGHKCAIGLFIPDNIYKPEMENCMLETLLFKFDLLKIIDNDDVDILGFLKSLQSIHDSIVTNGKEEFKKSLGKLALRYNLSIVQE